MTLNSKVYDILKWIVITALPALTAFLGIILPVCGVSGEVVQVVLTILAALTTFIGTLIGVSSYNYHKEQAAADTAIGIGTGENKSDGD